jgi:hypothetical protein
MKQLQHSSEMYETLEIYICNIDEEEPVPVNSGRQSGSQRRVAARDDLYIGFLRSLVKSPLFFLIWMNPCACVLCRCLGRQAPHIWLDRRYTFIHTYSIWIYDPAACMHARSRGDYYPYSCCVVTHAISVSGCFSCLMWHLCHTLTC